MPDTPGNFDDDGPVTGKQTISIVATLLRFFRQNAVERSHKCIDFQQRTTRPKSVQSAISLSIKGVLAPEARPFSTGLSTAFCGTLLPRVLLALQIESFDVINLRANLFSCLALFAN